ncbi:E3 binding domain-containing protein [Georgenia sp. SUBG003]|uniref:E3 binding domain-containing protein n=1 Tax=Georgenia sp. SUBG003 TaxID=1497974 RepID=UPI003AB8B542
MRKLAKDLGVDLTTVGGSGPGGIITREDVWPSRPAPRPSRWPPTRVTRSRGWRAAPSRWTAARRGCRRSRCASARRRRWWRRRSRRRT